MPLSPDSVPRWIRRYDPIGPADDDRLTHIDETYAEGVPRSWATFTKNRPDRPKPGQVVAVLNPDDDAAVACHLATIHDLDQGRIVVAPCDISATSAGGSFGAAHRGLGSALLAALGKDPDDIADTRSEALALAGSWMHGERVSDLVVDRAHALPEELLHELAAFARDAGVRLLLTWVANPLQRPVVGA